MPGNRTYGARVPQYTTAQRQGWLLGSNDVISNSHQTGRGRKVFTHTLIPKRRIGKKQGRRMATRTIGPRRARILIRKTSLCARAILTIFPQILADGCSDSSKPHEPPKNNVNTIQALELLDKAKALLDRTKHDAAIVLLNKATGTSSRNVAMIC